MTIPLVLHIAGGTAGLLSGIVAVSSRKGARLHRAAGSVFFVSMLVMSAFATWLAIPLQQAGNIIGGIFTFYLIATAWMTVRRKERTSGMFEIAAMLAAFGGALAMLYFGVQALGGPKPPPGGAPVAAYFLIAGVAGLAGALDLKVVLQGGLSGVPRIARHLWRMCFALFIAVGSFYTQFVVRKVHLPPFLHERPLLLFIPIVAPLLLIPFWMARLHFTKWYKGGGTTGR